VLAAALTAVAVAFIANALLRGGAPPPEPVAFEAVGKSPDK